MSDLNTSKLKKAKSDATPGKAKTDKLQKNEQGVVLLSGGNPQIAKADGDAPVQAYIAAMPGWKSALGKQLDELIVRMIRRTGSISGGVDAGNKARIRLKVLQPGTRMKHLDYEGFDDATLFDFPAFPGTPYPGKPSVVIFRWTGISWLPAITDLP